MRRTFFILAATAAGLFLLLSFESTPQHAPSSQAAVAPPAPPAPANRSRPGGHWITGPVAQTPFGPVQVRVSLTGHHINDIRVLQLPSDFSLSQQISAYSGPRLRQEALRAQSGRIDTVSGATYTSGGYRQSLQAVLDRNQG
jgi:uncharacterized protein with FMN-binding domain